MEAQETKRTVNSLLSNNRYQDPKRGISSDYIVELGINGGPYLICYLKVLDIKSGNILFEYEVKVATVNISGPFIDNNKVFFQISTESSVDKIVYSLDMLTGVVTPVAKFAIDGNFWLIGAYNGNIYYVGIDNKIRGYSILEGKETIFTTSNADSESRILKSYRGMIYTKNHPNNLSLMGLEDNNVLLEINTDVDYINIVGDIYVIYADSNRTTTIFDITTDTWKNVEFYNIKGDLIDVNEIVGSSMGQNRIQLWDAEYPTESTISKNYGYNIAYHEYYIYQPQRKRVFQII